MGTVTIGGNDFDVYSETSDPIADTTIYFSAKIGSSAWTDAAEIDQQQALVTATRWVRNWLAGQLSPEPDPADTPAPLLVAQGGYEVAFALIEDPTIQENATTTSNNKRLKAGSVEIEFFKPVNGSVFPSAAQRLLNEFLNEEGVGATGSLASGTDGVSEFCDPDRYGRVLGVR